MRIAIDATPAAVQTGGVGRYTRELIRALVQETDDDVFILSLAASDEASRALFDQLPPGAWREIRRLPARERVMTTAWHRLRIPILVERWVGDHDLFHGTDFTLPPTNASTVVTIHDLSFLVHPEFAHPKLRDYLQAVVPRSVARADVVITVSASVAADVAAAFPDAQHRIVAIPNGVDAPEGFARHEAARPTVLIVGTIEPRKNHATVLRAMADVRVAIPDAKLLIVGRRGWLYAEIEQKIQAGIEAGWIEWLDDASDAELEDAYRRATIAISASHYEGFGLPVLESLARGIACVVSDIPAHREVAGDNAVYVPVDQPAAIADAIVELIDEPQRREQIAGKGQMRAARFSWRETARRTRRAYQAALGRESS